MLGVAVLQECVAPTVLFPGGLPVPRQEAPTCKESVMSTSSRGTGTTGSAPQPDSPDLAEQPDSPDLAEQPEAPRARAEEQGRLRVHYPAADTAVLTVSGEVDDANVGRLSSLVHQRLASLLEVFVVDLSAVGFLSLSGVEILTHAAHRARATGPQLRLVVATPTVRRAVQAAELQQVVACYSSLSQALSELPAEPPAPRGQHAPATTSAVPQVKEQP